MFPSPKAKMIEPMQNSIECESNLVKSSKNYS